MISADVTPEEFNESSQASRLVGALLSPSVITTLVVIVGIGLVIGIAVHRHTTDAADKIGTSTPAANTPSLSVRPLTESTSTGAASNDTLQSAPGGNSTATSPSAADNQLGASPATNYQSTASSLNQFSGQHLSN